jgi:putative flavoprotein involved in K+ transport
VYNGLVIAVIGAGPAGLAAAAMLQEAGEEVVVLERGEVAEAWTTRYDRLHLHTVRWLSCLPGYRIPRAFGKWPSRDGVVDYLHAYADRHGR